jgi:aspartate aminotransferase-like enzyme
MKKKYLLTPGPTPVPSEVLAKEGLPILHHRTTEFSNQFNRVKENLKTVFCTKNDVLILSSSGTGAMESAVVNLLSKNSKALVLDTGVFGNRWVNIIKAIGLESIVVKEEYGNAVDLSKVKEILDNNKDITAVFTTLTETSTGTVNDIKSISEIVQQTNAVLVVDAVSGLAGEVLKTDEWGVDVVVSGSQKGLMIPPGLAFISFSDKAWSLVEKSDLPKFYFDLKKYKKKLPDGQTPFTPPVSLISGLEEALNMIIAEGMENIWDRHNKMAKAVREAFTALGLELFSKSPSSVVTSVKVPDGIEGGKIVKILREKYGVSIAGGQLEMKGKIFRMAHMGYMERFDLVIGISAIEMILTELGYKVELGKGVAIIEKNILTW